MGLIHLDAGVLIGFLDGADVHHDKARERIADALQASDQLEVAASAVAECLVGPARRGNAAISTVHALIERLPITVVPLDLGIATAAARIRASHRSLRLPDALVIATALERGADELVTTDRKWPTARALKLGGKVTRLA